MTIVPFDSLPDHPVDPMYRFLDQECQGKSVATVRRYHQVIAALVEFLEGVDVTAVYGERIQAHLHSCRQRLGRDAFIEALGYPGVVRVLPMFLEAPWLPPPGQQRRTHRSLVERLITYLRRQGLIDSTVLRTDLKVARKAVQGARSLDYGIWPRPERDEAGVTTVTVDLELSNNVLDDLLDDAEEGDVSLSELITRRLDPPDDPYVRWY
ncbi:MAG TPA: hypothetical protein VNZ66_08000 [Aeromicrobium sp.]|nr:hypothetical protein [Aeromicrobium sp.]